MKFKIYLDKWLYPASHKSIFFRRERELFGCAQINAIVTDEISRYSCWVDFTLCWFCRSDVRRQLSLFPFSSPRLNSSSCQDDRSQYRMSMKDLQGIKVEGILIDMEKIDLWCWWWWRREELLRVSLLFSAQSLEREDGKCYQSHISCDFPSPPTEKTSAKKAFSTQRI